MDTNFNTVIYQLEMLSLVNTAIKKLKAEHPDYEVFTMSLTTAGPPRSGISKRKQNSIRNIYRLAI